MKDELLKRIADYQLLNGSFCTDLGIFNGKTGIALFFFYYARYTRISWYEDFAGELLDEIVNELSVDTPISFSNGLCGIGWGIEYLRWQKFVEGNTDEILVDLDRIIMERDVRRILDYSFETGLYGIVSYVMSRLAAQRNNSCVPFDQKYLIELEAASRQGSLEWGGAPYDMQSIWNRIVKYYFEFPSGEELCWKKGLNLLMN